MFLKKRLMCKFWFLDFGYSVFNQAGRSGWGTPPHAPKWSVKIDEYVSRGAQNSRHKILEPKILNYLALCKHLFYGLLLYCNLSSPEEIFKQSICFVNSHGEAVLHQKIFYHWFLKSRQWGKLKVTKNLIRYTMVRYTRYKIHTYVKKRLD